MVGRQCTVDQLKAFLESEAKQGNRIIHDNKTIWAGLGNRSGLHEFASTLCSEKWMKSGPGFLKKVDKLAVPGKLFFIQEYRNKTRDRGSWVDCVSAEVIA